MRVNFWYFASLFISIIVAIPILTVFTSFFDDTTNYFQILKNTFLYEYIFNTLILLIGVLFLTFILGVGSAYLVSFYNFPGVKFFKWALILSFAVPAYIYAYSLTAFFENYGTLFSILKSIFGDGEYNKFIPKFDGFFGAIISISFSLFGYVYVLTRSSFHYQSQNLIELGQNLGFSKSLMIKGTSVLFNLNGSISAMASLSFLFPCLKVTIHSLEALSLSVRPMVLYLSSPILLVCLNV